MHIRAAAPADAPAIAAIYAAEVLGGWATFDLVPPPVEHWSEVIGHLQDGHHLLVVSIDDEVLGYAKSGTFRPRPAYDSTVETSIYLRQQGIGLGTALYKELLDRLDAGPCHLAVANIALPNAASVRLHERLGYAPAGTLHEVGHKLGAWHDVRTYQRPLARA